MARCGGEMWWSICLSGWGRSFKRQLMLMRIEMVGWSGVRNSRSVSELILERGLGVRNTLMQLPDRTKFAGEGWSATRLCFQPASASHLPSEWAAFLQPPPEKAS